MTVYLIKPGFICPIKHTIFLTFETRILAVKKYKLLKQYWKSYTGRLVRIRHCCRLLCQLENGGIVHPHRTSERLSEPRFLFTNQTKRKLKIQKGKHSKCRIVTA